MNKLKTITELRNSLFESFDDVVSGKILEVSHKNGSRIAMIPIDELEKLENEAELHKNLAIGYAQALRGEGISTQQLKQKLKSKEKALREKYS